MEFLKERAQQSAEIRKKELELEKGTQEQQLKAQQQQADVLKLMHHQQLQNQQQRQQFQKQQKQFQQQQMLMMQQFIGVMSKMLNKNILNFFFSMFTCLRFTFLQNVQLRVFLSPRCLDLLVVTFPANNTQQLFNQDFMQDFM